MDAVFIIYLAVGRLLGLDVSLSREAIEDAPVDGWRTFEPGPVSARIERKA